MAFIEHLPLRKSENKDFSIGIINNKSVINFNGTVDFFNTVGIKQGDKVKFYYDDQNLRSWKIEKASSGESGYKVIKSGKRLRIQITLKIAGLSLNNIELQKYERGLSSIFINVT
jgi:hypothetical protein